MSVSAPVGDTMPGAGRGSGGNLTHIAEALRPLAVPVVDLVLDPANARKHPERNLDAIAASLRRFGQRKPVVVQKAGMIVRAGNGTVTAARSLGWSHVAAVVVDEASVDATAFAIADNRTAELAEWDEPVLAGLLDSLPDEALPDTGFTEDDLRKLIASVEDRQITEDEAPEPLPDPVSRTGDLWVMGEHRLLCGDSTKAEDVETLMGGEKAGLCFTSPPYGQQRDYTAASKEHTSDWDKLMEGVFACLPMADEGQVLVNLGMIHRDGEWVPYWDGWIEWMRKQGWRRFGWYVWDQGPGMPGDWQGRFAPSHEWVFHFNRQSAKPVKARDCKHAGEKHGGKGQRAKDGHVKERSAGNDPVQSTAILDSVIRVNRQGASANAGGHPAPFPVGLPAACVSSWHGVVYEPFSGSGTTIIAAEQLGRKCYAIEIEPRYVDVGVRRWQKLTGKAATLNGKTFSEVAAERGVTLPNE